MKVPAWTEFTARRPFLTPRMRRGVTEPGNALEKIANTRHIDRRRSSLIPSFFAACRKSQ